MRRLFSAVSSVLVLASMMAVALVVAPSAGAEAGGSSAVFINELHYDNDGGDVGEFVEIAGPAGTDLTGWSIVRYNGNGGAVYGSDTLAGTLADAGDGYGFVVQSYPANGLQNGAPDGIALVDAADNVVQFLSYEGTFAATGGPAAGLTSFDIGVSESGATQVGESLQLTGTGTAAGDFTWAPAGAETPGAANTGQSFGGGGGAPADPVLNELGISDAGPDDEFVEIFGDPDTNYAAFTVLQLESDPGTANPGQIDAVVAVGSTGPGGLWVSTVGALGFENDNSTFLLVENFTGAADDDLDTNDDGTLDVEPWTRIVDAVAIDDVGGIFYGLPALGEAFDDARLDNPFAPGGLSRIPDGADTDTAADWFRNDFSWDGVTNGSPEPGEALNTPGAPNEIVALPAPTVVISELHYDNEGADVGEFVEVTGDAGTDLTGWSIVLYNGNGGGVYGTETLGGTLDDEAGGQGAVSFPIAGLQNGAPDGVALVDPSDNVIEFLSYEGSFTAVGGPADGLTSTDIGVAESGGTPVGQSLQLVDGVWNPPAPESPGDLNSGGVGPLLVPIHDVQGPGASSPFDGQQVVISGIVVGDFQTITTNDPSDEALGGFFVQEEDVDADADPATSEGIFVFDPDAIDVAVGDLVEVTGTVDEFFGLTEITNVSDITVLSSGNPLPTPATPIVPTTAGDAAIDWEAIEGMSVVFTQPLFVSDLFELGRYGEIGLSAIGPWDHPNQVAPFGSTAAAAVRDLNRASRVVLDDGEDENESFSGISTWNPNPTPYLGGPEATLRAGDVINDLFGVVHFAFGEYEVQPINLSDPNDPDGGVSITRTPRPAAVPDVGGDLQVASFNVLNYFVTLDDGPDICGPSGNLGCRGADTQAEFDLQSAKIADAIADLDADIVGLIELENSGTNAAIEDLVAKVNALSSRTYDYIPTGFIGTDAIVVGFIYDTATVAPDGDFAVLDSSVSPAYLDNRNRPALAQTFVDLGSGANMTVAVNHLKSKGSPCANDANPGDPAFGVAPYAAGDDVEVAFEGNCNLARAAAAKVLGQWLASEPTGIPSENLLILGDLNAYAQEDPITELEAQGYTDLKQAFTASPSWADGGHSYVFDGEFGTLDYAMANAALTAQVTGAAAWKINADEPFAIDYQNFNPPGQASPDQWKSSDHDPVIIGLTLTPPGRVFECGSLTFTEAELVDDGYNLIIGNDGPERIRGTRGNDFIFSAGGLDIISAGRGDDIICSGAGPDIVNAGGGDDIVDSAGGWDLVIAGRGDDTVYAGGGRDFVNGGRGHDTTFDAERTLWVETRN